MRGFSLETHAVATLCKPHGMPRPFWVNTVAQIRHLVLTACRFRLSSKISERYQQQPSQRKRGLYKVACLLKNQALHTVPYRRLRPRTAHQVAGSLLNAVSHLRHRHQMPSHHRLGTPSWRSDGDTIARVCSKNVFNRLSYLNSNATGMNSTTVAKAPKTKPTPSSSILTPLTGSQALMHSTNSTPLSHRISKPRRTRSRLGSLTHQQAPQKNVSASSKISMALTAFTPPA